MINKEIKQNKGITLIALVITIIVLLILAGVAIAMLSGENGILRKAAEAKTKTDEAQTSETEDLKGLEYLIKKNTGDRCWQYKKDTNGKNTIITDGTIELPIGTYINYDPTKDENGKEIEKTITSNAGSPVDKATTSYYAASEKVLAEGNGYGPQTFNNKATTNGWRLLGVDEKTGELLIISADAVKTIDDKNFHLGGITGYNYGEGELNKVCSVFGSGYGATGARSVNIDDVNKITGYNPNNVGVYDPNQTGTGKKYLQGSLNEYGNQVTYSWTSTENQISVLGSNTKDDTGSQDNYAKYGFNWYDIASKTWKKSVQNTSNPIKIVTLKSNYYYYSPSLNTESEEYKTIFKTTEGVNTAYWLASSFINTLHHGALFGMHNVARIGQVHYYYLYYSFGTAGSRDSGVRPVVSLKADIELKEGTDGSYDLK